MSFAYVMSIFLLQFYHSALSSVTNLKGRRRKQGQKEREEGREKVRKREGKRERKQRDWEDGKCVYATHTNTCVYLHKGVFGGVCVCICQSARVCIKRWEWQWQRLEKPESEGLRAAQAPASGDNPKFEE